MLTRLKIFIRSLIAQTRDIGLLTGRIGTYLDLGFDDLVLHGPGEDQSRFIAQFSADVLPRLRERAASIAG